MSQDGFSAEADDVERHSIGRNSAVMASGTLVSRVLGLVRTSLTGAAIGLGVVGDAFNGANQLPNYIYLLISGGLLEPVIVPQIAKAAKRADSKKYIDQLVTISLLMLAVVTIAVTVAAPWLFSLLQLTPEAQKLGTIFAFICLPQVFFYGVYTVLSQVLNARGSYGAPMWAPAVNNLISIAGLAAFIALYGFGKNDPGTWTSTMIWLFAGTATLGIVAQGLILIPPLIKDGFRWRPSWGFPREEFAHLSRYTAWTFVSLLVSTIGGLVILSVTSMMPTIAAERGIEGFVAGNNIMNYAFMIFMLPQSIIAVSVITAIFPPMTRAWQSKNMPALRKLLKQGLELPAIFLIPATVAVMVLAGPLVHVLFPGNSEVELRALAPVLVVMCIGMLPVGIQTLQIRYCYASEQGKANLIFQIATTGIQLGIAALAVKFADPRHGVMIVTAGQSFAYIVGALAFVLFARHQVRQLSLGGTFRLYVRLLIASGLAGFCAWGSAELVLMISTGWLMHVVALGIGCLVFIAIFTVCAKVMRITEYFDLVTSMLGRFRRS